MVVQPLDHVVNPCANWVVSWPQAEVNMIQWSNGLSLQDLRFCTPDADMPPRSPKMNNKWKIS